LAGQYHPPERRQGPGIHGGRVAEADSMFLNTGALGWKRQGHLKSSLRRPASAGMIGTVDASGPKALVPVVEHDHLIRVAALSHADNHVRLVSRPRVVTAMAGRFGFGDAGREKVLATVTVGWYQLRRQEVPPPSPPETHAIRPENR
jgi:hypothetical protein